ncbi:unknown protein [Desulfotalea psychrophila LSv54]|uniref:Uncharacterized protein n=1 Tax=Desulfotalea psychrophila (strain LSv54 / DSM 12343) TaxID=177439 RepID=Q6ANI5_DESPS|nr:unknown protein [Desulfotalea psychrophila LSv54]
MQQKRKGAHPLFEIKHPHRGAVRTSYSALPSSGKSLFFQHLSQYSPEPISYLMKAGQKTLLKKIFFLALLHHPHATLPTDIYLIKKFLSGICITFTLQCPFLAKGRLSVAKKQHFRLFRLWQIFYTNSTTFT